MYVSALASGVKNYQQPYNSVKLNNTQKPKNQIFKGLIGAWQIERALKKKYNIECNFGFNEFVAECIKTTTTLFDDLFGRSSLPKTAEFKSFRKAFKEDDSTLGMHIHYLGGINGVYFNSDSNCFKTKNKLKFNEMTNKLLWWHPTGNYLQTFVHEYAHSAHYKHLCSRGNEYIMYELQDTRIPTVIGRLITKFKLGRYSATNMNEFMAERITKDVCKNLSGSDKFLGHKRDLDYENIFSNKWSYRYTSPQSYLDYFTQQVWNGDTEKAEEVAADIEHYLKRIEAARVHPVLETVTEKAGVEKESWLSKIAKKLYETNLSYTKELDKKNELRLRRDYL